ncbi:hypothetical protein [Pseudothauera rhizosphaerae]|uniref:Type II toxin-antitoxin system RelE/ParE family toxin n=1 Tax=Pseudothauera rhizosphaerae TaxID=2565932 RepID=A0A4S4AXV7_9RHOO|nr:hypothetical protein [Pseudothauera rhizosphaerae]THF64158.1 hypothetical protein E6O51_02195 [Pseudothauera rhizosphaerae]
MTLPQRARVEAAPNFLANLDDARRFLRDQDETTAQARFGKLRGDLREMVAVLAWTPAGGRPARFLSARSAQARLRAARIQALAAEAGLPYLREYVIGRYIVLYAHSATEVVLLALKHERQLGYSVT